MARLIALTLAIAMILSLGGEVYALSRVATAAQCCHSSCPQPRQSDPVQCCDGHYLPAASAVAPAHHAESQPRCTFGMSLAVGSVRRLERVSIPLRSDS